MKDRHSVNIYVGRTFGKMEVTSVGKETLVLLCQCGNSQQHKRGNKVYPMQCRECNKKETQMFAMGNKSDKAMVIREYTPIERRMINDFIKAQRCF